MGNNKNHVEIALSRFGDVVKLNAFIGTNPEYATLTYKTSRLAKLWELEIEDERNRWIVGYDIGGFGDVALEHSVGVKRRRRGHVDNELFTEQELYVVRWKGGYIFITLPNENKKDVVITAPQVCGRCGATLMEPVYIWRDIIEWYHVLDCRHGTQIFETISDLETWLYEEAEGGKLPWSEWYVVEGIVDSDEDWIDAVKRAVVGELGPAPHEVIELVRRLTE
jgi:hypothetical protein